MRNIDLRAAYAKIYENRFAAHAGKDTDPGAKYAKPSKGGSTKGVYTLKGKDGKPLFDKREEFEAEGEQIDEIAPVIAAGVGKLAGAAAAKAGAGAAAKAGGGIAKAASSKMGKAALTKGGEMIGNKVEKKLSSEEVVRGSDAMDGYYDDSKDNAIPGKGNNHPKRRHPKDDKERAAIKKRKADLQAKYKKQNEEFVGENATHEGARNALRRVKNNNTSNKHEAPENSKPASGNTPLGNKDNRTDEDKARSEKAQREIEANKKKRGMKEAYLEIYAEGKMHDDERHRKGSGGSIRQGSQLPQKNLKPMKRQEAGEPAASDNKGKGKAVKNTMKVPRGTPTQPKRLAMGGPKDHVRGKEHMDKVDMKDPSTKKAIEKMAADHGAKQVAKKAAYKNFANKMEKQRRDDLDKRYGPKKEELECVFAILMSEGVVDNEDSAITLITHMSDDWFDTLIDQIYEGEMIEEEAKKDACYHKVKASAKVWPSAYASGRLVQCRKKGASNYGKSKKD